MTFYDRIADALGAHEVHPADRRTIQLAYLDADSFEDMPAEVQKLVKEIEASPRESWDDPSEVPGNAPLEG